MVSVHEPPLDDEKLLERLTEYMSERGLRWTQQRRLVTDVFFDNHDHVSIEELLALVRERDARVGYTTVYRTLKLLTDSGVANERNFGDGLSRYELSHEDEHHDHLVCLDCGKIVEFENDEIERLQAAHAKRLGVSIRSHKHELYARCIKDNCPDRAKKGEHRLPSHPPANQPYDDH